ncbi:MAG TPA: aldo/keto reductase, partial [Ktedonobacteraceae bacterium]|nr:aldo/keto reductase [Ktedonobacteraceae bacterium]
TDRTLSAVQKLEGVAKDLNCKLSQLALAWVLRQENVSAAIIGASRPAQVEENIKAGDIKLSEDVLKKIDEILANVASFDRQ